MNAQTGQGMPSKVTKVKKGLEERGLEKEEADREEEIIGEFSEAEKAGQESDEPEDPGPAQHEL